jgi:predicted DNA-binding protein with PD1-like motif
VVLSGVVALGEGGPKVHAHVVLGRADGSAMGGHLIEAHVRPTLELTLIDGPRKLVRRDDPATGLALIDLGRERTGG